MIVLDDVHKSFGEVRALRGVSFRADDGKITGILGPNGAGKTTALRILYTVLRQDSGSARIDDFDTLEDRHEVQKRIGVCRTHMGFTRGSPHVRTFVTSESSMGSRPLSSKRTSMS